MGGDREIKILDMGKFNLGVAVLLWVVMRRSQVRPWTATVAASASSSAFTPS